ncbi:hypothetical protein [Agromyces cerinus]|uniref:Uncharacterized protein n=1 Tax=Agromyces cerinus subsp. cerinus TaxID=232089 RepID=A0A1N6E7Q6_9MICO|nr:hypothetical protein [Agromyces cerinus]SIN79079.1 hypothetical protein SAMN05443544_1189 [Agromyces cerinus subsp. cerinus]
MASTPPSLAALAPTFSSSIDGFAEGYEWAVQRALNWVQSDRPGVLPSYWAGLTDRPMFYSRDVAHQALGAHFIGLDEENFTMLRHFAASATPARRYFPLWSFHFDGRPARIDYRTDRRFVRETPVVFELVERSLDMYLWTGDDRYLDDPAMQAFYENTLTRFTELHDPFGWRIAGASGTRDIFTGTATYNEGPKGPGLRVAGDGIASQWAALARAATVFDGSALGLAALREAEHIQARFEDSWWDSARGHYATGFTARGASHEFAFEPSWFPAVKSLMAPDRAQRHLDFVAANLRETPPPNIEAFTYLPEAFFAYGRDAEAIRWIRHLIDSRDDYPEVSFSVIAHLLGGLTGLRAVAPRVLETRSHLPDGDVEARGVPYRDHRLDIRHEGGTRSTLTVHGGTAPLVWRARVAHDVHERIVSPGETASVGT